MKMWLVVLFYSILWTLISKYVFHDEVSNKACLTAVFPITYQQYWFITAYIVMYMLSPVLNLLIENINKPHHLFLVLFLICIFCVWPDILPYSNVTGTNSKGYTAIWFMVLYLIAAYVRKYPVVVMPKRALGYYLLSAVIIVALWAVIAYATGTMDYYDEVHGGITFYYYRYNSLIVLATAVFLWLAFINIHINNVTIQKIIKVVAPLTMSVYLIHDHALAREFVWKGLQGLEATWTAPFWVIGYVIAIFVICLVIDECRMILFSIFNKRTIYKIWLQKLDAIPDVMKTRLEKFTTSNN